MQNVLLKTINLHTQFDIPGGTVYAVNGMDIEIKAGETVGLVGESGSGKSVTALSVMGLLPDNGRVVEGEIWFKGQYLLTKTDKEWREIRGKEISLVFQDPVSAFNPAYTIGRQIAEVICWHKKVPWREAVKEAVEVLELVGIPEAKVRAGYYPHQLSGGLIQRAMLAMALACKPQLLLADEPTNFLDVTLQAQVLDLLRTIQEKLGMGILFITHNLGLVAGYCDRVLVAYAGMIFEEAPVKQLFDWPRHPYTRGLLDAMLPFEKNKKLPSPIPGNAPDPLNLQSGCPFEPRCSRADINCREARPVLKEIGPDHKVACHNVK